MRRQAQRLWVRQALCTRGSRQEQRLLWHDDPRNGIRYQTNAGHEGSDEPHHADDGHVDVKLFGNSQADSSDLSSLSRTNQALPCYRSSDARPAIGANGRVVLNHFAAIVAVHVPPLFHN